MPNEKLDPNVEALIASAVDVILASEAQPNSSWSEVSTAVVDRLAGSLDALNARGMVRDRRAKMVIEDYNGQRVFSGRPSVPPPKPREGYKLALAWGAFLAVSVAVMFVLSATGASSCPTG